MQKEVKMDGIEYIGDFSQFELVDMTNWKTYRSEEYGIEFKYPDMYRALEMNEYGVVNFVLNDVSAEEETLAVNYILQLMFTIEPATVSLPTWCLELDTKTHCQLILKEAQKGDAAAAYYGKTANGYDMLYMVNIEGMGPIVKVYLQIDDTRIGFGGHKADYTIDVDVDHLSIAQSMKTFQRQLASALFTVPSHSRIVHQRCMALSWFDIAHHDGTEKLAPSWIRLCSPRRDRKTGPIV